MKYCQHCIIPDTRPNIELGEHGICNACRTHITKKPKINWTQREGAFRRLVQQAKSRSSGYDCLIPVSGGKDSIWQVVQCLQYGLNPLTVTYKTPGRTKLGAQNLRKLVHIGVDHIDYQINPKVEKKFMYQALLKYGSTALPMHMALFNIPLKIAVDFNIPLVVWGENSALEYGGTEEECEGVKLDSNWFKKYGVTHGTSAQDWVSSELSAQELTPYFGPTEAVLEDRGILAIFLGCFFPWDVETSLEVARDHGFQVRQEGPKTGYYNYADIDDDFISIHHYLKWYKFGFTRLFDNLSLEIRNQRLTRLEAIEIIRNTGDQTPHDDIAKFCDFVEIRTTHFWEVIEKFRNLDIWLKKKGNWQIKDFLIPDWNWS